MAVNFPSSPYIGEIYTYGVYSWEWNGTYWESYSPPSSGLTGATSVGVGDSVIGGITNNVLELKSFSGDNITIIDDGSTLMFSAGTSPIGGVTTLTAGSGLSGDTTTGDITLINTEPDQIVSLSGGTSMSVTGTYPSFTISYTGASGGGVTTLTAGSGLSGDTTTGAVTLINTEPDQTVTITGGTNIQITGTYPDFGVNFTGTTGSNFTGGTVSGATNFTGGLTANTISATTYYNLPVSAVTNGTGISASTSNGVVTITNTEPNQIVTISGGTGITTGGTYPNFTITNSSPDLTVSITGGSNIGITGTYPNFSVDFTGGTVTGGTSFTAGLSANTMSATTYNNAPFVTGGTYTSGTITFSNATGGTFNVTGLPVGGQGGQLYYFNTSVTQTPYKEFGSTGTSASEQSTTISIASGITSTIESYLTPSGYPNSLILPGGVWSFFLHSYKEDSSSNFNLFCDVYKRTSGGTETYLFSTDPFDVTATASTPSMGISDAYFSGTPLTVSDRILVLVRATNTGTSTKQITFVTEGLQHYSYGITTFNGIPANVSSLTTGVGLSGNATTGAVTIINTAPDLTVSITGGTNIGITGTYPNFGVDFTGGTVAYPINLTSGLTANTISATTYYNLPYSGTVTGSGTPDTIPKWTGGGVLGDSQITDDGSYVTIPNLIISTSGFWNPSPVDTNVSDGETLYPLYVDINSGITQSLNEGFMNSGKIYLNNTFLTIKNDSDHRAIKIFYSIRSDDDNYFRSGDIIANWDSGYTSFFQTEYGPTSNQPLPDTIDVPVVGYNGVNTELRIYVSGTSVLKYILKIKYILL